MATGGAIVVNDDCESLDEDDKLLFEMQANESEIEVLRIKEGMEKIKIEQEYNNLRKPYFEKRNELIQKIPEFWLIMFGCSPHIAEIIDDEEERCLNFLTKLEVEDYEDIKSGYRLKFHFDENPYFENDVIVKEIHFESSAKCQSTAIKWKDNMDLVKRLPERQVQMKKQSRKRRKSTEMEPRSFFEWFADNKDPETDHIAKTIKAFWRNLLRYNNHPLVLEVEGNESSHGRIRHLFNRTKPLERKATI